MLNRDTERDWLNYKSWSREKRNALENGLKLGKKNLRKKKPEEMKWRKRKIHLNCL